MSTSSIGKGLPGATGRLIPSGYTDAESDLMVKGHAKISRLVKTVFENTEAIQSALRREFPEFSTGDYPHIESDLFIYIMEKNHLCPAK